MTVEGQARIELLEKLVRELEQESAIASETVLARDSAGQPEQGGEAKPDQGIESANGGATKDDSVKDTTEVTAKSPVPHSSAKNDDSKRTHKRLALYRDLLALSQTEIPNSTSPQPDHSNVHASPTPKPVLPAPPPVSDEPDTTPAVKNPDVPVNNEKTAEPVAPEAVQNNSDPAAKSTAADAQPPTEAAEPPTSSTATVPVDEPIVVKAEPVDIDITAMLNAAGAEAAQSGESDPTPPVSNSAHIQHEPHTSHGDASMEEDPLLAELFPTFPMGNSPVQAHQTQAEEEADPLLAGMLQEVSINPAIWNVCSPVLQLDATNGHVGMTYDGLEPENFSAGWNPWAEVPHVIPETYVSPLPCAQHTHCGNSIVQVASAFDMDPDPHKMNLGLIGFREDSGRIFVPPTTRQVSLAIVAPSRR